MSPSSLFVIARENSRPGGQLRDTLEHTHVDAQFGNDCRCQSAFYARDLLQEGELGGIGLQLLLNASLEHRDEIVSDIAALNLEL